ITKYIKKHKRSLFITAGITGGVYLLGKYAKWKINELQEKTQEEKRARENMRRRFQQRQSDCTFAIMDHLSTIADSLLTEFDVESIIVYLQRAKNTTASASSSIQSTPNVSPSTSVVLVDDSSASATPSSSMVFVEKDAGRMAESINNNDSSSGSSGQDSDEQSPTSTNHSALNKQLDKKSKVECWNEVKYK
ncbi:5745_t:CDS:2, partial [Acaulospora colombiana]